MRYIISAIGVFAALGFIAASAYSNYLFSSTIASNINELYLYRALSVLAVACTSLCPFFIRYNRPFSLARISAIILFVFALLYSFTSAFGLAATNRTNSAEHTQNANQSTEDIRAEITELKTRKRTWQINARIDDLNRKLETKGETHTADAQATLISKIVGTDTTTIRIALSVVYAFYIELGAALLLYCSLAHFTERKSGGTQTANHGVTSGNTDTTPGTGTGRPGQLQLSGPSRVKLPRPRPTPKAPGHGGRST